MWNTLAAPVPIFEDEDEQALIGLFVQYSARYPDRNPYEICAHIFKDLRDPFPRSDQAASQWSKDLEILERIRQAKINGGTEQVESDPKKAWQAEVYAIINDPNLGPQEKKARLDGMKLIGESNAWVTKSVDKTSTDKTRHFPQVVFALHPSAANA